MGKPGDLGVLIGDAVPGVDHDEAHVRPLDGQLRPHDGELLHPLVHLGLAADAGGVDEHIAAQLVFIHGVHRVPGGAGHVADDDPLLPQDVVHQGALAHVGLADDGHLDEILVLPVLFHGREVLETLVQQIAGAVAVDGGGGDGVAQSQGVELIHAKVGGAGGVGLVHRQHHGLLGAQQHVGHVLIRRGDAGAQVGHKDDDRGLVDGDLRLLPHEEQDLAVGGGLDAAGVHHIEFAPAPLALGIEPISGDAGGVLHNGEALPHQAVKEHGFAHVGSSNDGYQRF